MAEVTAYNVWLLAVALISLPLTATSVTWTAPPPQWIQTDPSYIRTVDKPVVNGRTQVPLRWIYTLSAGSLIITTFSIRLNDGSFDAIGTTSGGVFNKNDYRTRFYISGSEVATLIINKVTETEEAVYQCKLTTDFNEWSYRIRVIVTVPASLTNVSRDQTVCKSRTCTYCVKQLVNQHQTSPGPECWRMAVMVKYCTMVQLGIFQTSAELALEHTAVQLTTDLEIQLTTKLKSCQDC